MHPDSRSPSVRNPDAHPRIFGIRIPLRVFHRNLFTANFLQKPHLAAFAVVAGMWLLVPGVVIAGDFYLRGSIGLDRPGGTEFTDIDCMATSPAALYGCGAGGDGAPYRSSRGDFGTVPVVEFGFGYPSGGMRYEMLVEYRPRFSFGGRANFLAPGRRQSVSMDLSSVSGMLAGFFDFPKQGSAGSGAFVPFVGAGIGIAHTRTREMSMTFPVRTTTVPGANRTELAWMVTAGVAMAVGERTTLDLGWRYTDLGEVRTGRGAGRVVWRDGSRDPLPLDLAPTRARLAGHGFRISLRYAL